MLYFFILGVILLQVVIFLDIFHKINLSNKIVMSILLVLMPHVSIIIYMLINYDFNKEVSMGVRMILVIGVSIFMLYSWLKFNIRPYSIKKIEDRRLRVLMGGRRLLLYSLFIAIIQGILYIVIIKQQGKLEYHYYIIVMDVVITIISILTLLINGLIRVLVLSRRMNIFMRVFCIMTFYIPIMHIFVVFYLARKALSEYDHESNKIDLNKVRVDSSVCQTKYPIVMLHGVGFRDFKYINYWGRIPKELTRNGAKVYYGNQEAWGTIEYNANDVKEKIMSIIKETNCEKVNIIAHSKGGLDARYMVSQLDMADYVASLTMISTPHHGSQVIDFVYKLPNKFIACVGRMINWYFGILGDKNPDFFTASKQFLTANSVRFNDQVTDCPGVYYQSYASVMKNVFSDYILSFPYIIVRIMGGKNDGLVTVDSAKWGEFKGVLESGGRRGVSHGDMIDLRRNDYKGFDIREHYVSIVKELKNSGF